MRFVTALFFCFCISLLWTACDKDDDGMRPTSTIDCGTINTFDSSLCMALENLDSVAFVNSFLGTWYLAATQNSGFGGGSTECINFTEAESPYKFTFNADYTWRLIESNLNVDTTMGWTVTSGFAGWTLMSDNARYSTPQLRHLCDGNLVTDARPVDGDLRVYVRAN